MLSKIFFIAVLAAFVLGSFAYLAPKTNTAYCQGNVCAADKKGNCTGNCLPLYDINGQKTDSPVCEKVGKICACTHLDRPSNTCTGKGRACDGRCERLFRTPEDARNQRKPIKGDCATFGGPTCTCRYKL